MKVVLIVLATALLASFVLLIFKEQSEFIYDFNVQNCLMSALVVIVFLKYYRNFYKFAFQIVLILIGICFAINLLGRYIVDKYEYIGIIAIWDNYHQIIAICAALIYISFLISPINNYIEKINNNTRGIINGYYKKLMLDKELYDSRKYDAKYVCKFLFESNLKSLGLSGKYGAGKSFIIDKIIKTTRSIRNLYVVISPLSCKGEDISSYIVGQIERVLKENGIYTNNARQIFNTIQNSYLSSLLNIINGNQTISDLYKNLYELINGLDIKLTIIVDDLDRIYDKKQIQLIFIILDSIVSDNCKVIYLYDASILNKIFDDECGLKYIEKYIQDEYPLRDLTFRNLVKIENDDYIKNKDIDIFKDIHKIIDSEIGFVEFGTKIYGRKEEHAVFDISKLTPREINKIIRMTYEKLSNKKYKEAIKGFEKYVFRYYIFIFYFPELKQQINDIKNLDSFFIFEYNKKAITLFKVLEIFFSATKFGASQSEEQYNEFLKFLEISNNFNKLLALNILGYNIDIMRKNIINESEERSAFERLNRQEQIYNKFYRLADNDAFYYRDYYNDKKISAVIPSLINGSCSEYTDDEWFAKHFKEKVLDKEDMLGAYNNYTFQSYKDNKETIYLIGLNEFSSIFISINKAKVSNEYWNKLMELYYTYLLKDEKIVFNDVILENIHIFRFVSYKASIYAFMIISKFNFDECENKYLDVIFIPKIMSLIKDFIKKYYKIEIHFYYPHIEKYIRFDDIDECKKYLISFKEHLLDFIKKLESNDAVVKEKIRNDLPYVRAALEKLIDLIDNASKYKDSIKRRHWNMTEKIDPPDISKYKGKSKEEIDKLFDEDIEKNILRPIDYKRIMDEFNNE